MAFQNDFRACRHRQLAAQRRRHFGTPAAQQSGELVFRQAVGNWRDGTQDGGRVGAQRHGDRERLSWIGQLVVAEVQRAATVRQPAHDELVAS